MFQLFVLLLLLKGPDYIKATTVADSFVATNLNAILLMCPNDTNKDWSCVPQLIININFTPNLNVNNVEKLLILDETYEPTTRQTFKISPYIIIVSRSEPIMMFPLLPSNGTVHNLDINMPSNTIVCYNGNFYNNTYQTNTEKLKKLRRRYTNPFAYDIFGKLMKRKRENPYIPKNSSVQDNQGKKINNLVKSETEFCGDAKTQNSPTIFSAVKPTEELPEYSVYNLSAPFPYLAARIRIFRKRKQTWWRIMPVITTNNLSGTLIYGNISVLLTNHEDILQQKMPVFLEKFQLLIPNDFLNNPQEFDGLRIYKSAFLEIINNNTQKFFNFGHSKKTLNSDEIKPAIHQNGDTKMSDQTSGKILSKCPNNNQALCLNVVNDQVPEFDIKLKMPFMENSAQQNTLRVKISRIVSDATTKDALKISVDVINKGLKAEEFLISVCDCPLFESETVATTTVQKILIPYISETITFLLPFVLGSKKGNKFTCDILVKTFIQKFETNDSKLNKSNILIVSKRSMDIEANSRCFCVWNCRCHCIGKIDSHTDIRVCHKMSYESEKAAGLLLNCPFNDDDNDICSMDSSSEPINNNPSSDLLYRIIEIILLVFVVLFLLMLFCCKCFKPRKEDLMAASTEWFCYTDNNLITCSRYNDKHGEPSKSACTSSNSNKYFASTEFVPSGSDSMSPSLEITRKQSNQIDLLESALLSLTRQQNDLKKQSMKRE